MRVYEDPFNQEQLLILLRQGHSLSDSVKAQGHSLSVLKAERERDPVFDEKVYMAQAAAFTPVLRRIVEQAKDGDADDPATHKAWDLVVRHYNKALDREHKFQVIDHAYTRHEQAVGTPGLPAPTEKVIIDLIDAIRESRQQALEAAPEEAKENDHDQPADVPGTAEAGTEGES